jgi:hypothetical protein
MATSSEDVGQSKQTERAQDLSNARELITKDTKNSKLASDNEVKPKLFPAVAMVSLCGVTYYVT